MDYPEKESKRFGKFYPDNSDNLYFINSTSIEFIKYNLFFAPAVHLTSIVGSHTYGYLSCFPALSRTEHKPDR